MITRDGEAVVLAVNAGCSAIDGTATTSTPMSTLPKRTHRRQWMQTPPGLAHLGHGRGLARAARRRRHGTITGPVALASPTSAKPIAERIGVDADEARDARVGGSRRRVQLHGGEPEGSIDRSGRDIDELHAPVRDHRHVPEQQARGSRSGRHHARHSPTSGIGLARRATPCRRSTRPRPAAGLPRAH